VIKTIAKIGKSQGLIFDEALSRLTGLKVGDKVNVTVHGDGSIIIVRIGGEIHSTEGRQSARKVIRRNAALFKRLA
jgi:antitoxin component of MazEF toxin-antitoxin module